MRVIILLLIFFPLQGLCSSGENDCKAVELKEGQPAFNKMVCEAVRYAEIGFYGKALEVLSEASKLRFHEVPNFSLNTRIAHIYLLKGEIKKAKRYLEAARLSLSLVSGIYTCEEGKDGFYLSQEDGKIMDSALSGEVAMNMCGGEYDYYYNSRFKTLSGVARDGRLAEYYLQVADLINRRSQHNQ